MVFSQSILVFLWQKEYSNISHAGLSVGVEGQPMLVFLGKTINYWLSYMHQAYCWGLKRVHIYKEVLWFHVQIFSFQGTIITRWSLFQQDLFTDYFWPCFPGLIKDVCMCVCGGGGVGIWVCVCARIGEGDGRREKQRNLRKTMCLMGLPWWLSGKESACQCRNLEDPLGKGMTAHSNILAWKIPWTEEPGELQAMGSQKSGTQLSN